MLEQLKLKKIGGMAILLFWMVQTGWAAGPGTWAYYQDHFISPDGRVIDYFQGKSSHSEGQGYGMLLAVFHNDPSVFNRIFTWTRNNLMIRPDNLAAWRWGERPTGEWGIVDYNNATDGDLLIAWALLKAAKAWNQPDLRSSAMAIVSTIQTRLVLQNQGRMVLMPGYYGFDKEGETIVNPSYFVYPAFEQFAREGDAEFWQTLSAHCLDLSFHPLFTRLNLPGDWIILTREGKVALDLERSRNFGYEAIRIPLYLSLSANRTPLKAFSPYLDFYGQLGYLPALVDLEDEQISMDEAPAGFYAVFALCAKMMGNQDLALKLMKRAEEKIGGEPQDYYSNTLYLLARQGVVP